MIESYLPLAWCWVVQLTVPKMILIEAWLLYLLFSTIFTNKSATKCFVSVGQTSTQWRVGYLKIYTPPSTVIVSFTFPDTHYFPETRERQEIFSNICVFCGRWDTTSTAFIYPFPQKLKNYKSSVVFRGELHYRWNRPMFSIIFASSGPGRQLSHNSDTMFETKKKKKNKEHRVFFTIQTRSGRV